MKLSGSSEGNWSGPPSASAVDQPNSSEDDEDMDMRVDHFSDRGKSFNSLRDVSEAIEACKKGIYDTVESTDERKELVHKLIKLRIRYHDLRERQEHPIAGYETRGHTFVDYYAGVPIPGVSGTRKIYCQQCCGVIWVYLQSSQHCADCGFSVHSACMENIMRECVGTKVKSKPDFITEICPEKSLPSLNYCCSECDRALSRTNPKLEPRLCDYTGLSFCSYCHWNALSVTPARIICNWDFAPREVSQASKQYLYLMANKPVINIKTSNEKLFAVVQELNHVQQMRETIILMKKYLTVCRLASEQKILLHLAPKQHFVDHSDFYSIQDLLEVKSGSLADFLTKIVDTFALHIKTCILCLAKGFICEICDQTGRLDGTDPEDDAKSVIFPFDKVSATCPECRGVFHKMCFGSSSDCPKCARRRSREQ